MPTYQNPCFICNEMLFQTDIICSSKKYQSDYSGSVYWTADFNQIAKNIFFKGDEQEKISVTYKF